MDLRRFFTNQTWWGKVLGAFLGFLMGGPVGALFGILIGNFFDRGLNEHFASPLWHYHNEKRPNARKIFFEATYSTMGHISKADGRISEGEILAAKNLMQEMNLRGAQKAAAQFFFNEGKKENFKLKQTLTLLQKSCRHNPGLLKLFIDTQYNIAQIDGLSEKKIQIMNIILSYMHCAPINEQARFNEDFYRQRSSSSRREEVRPGSDYGLKQAYSVLQIQPTASKNDVKHAYRRLISRNHPDKMIAQNLPKEQIQQANEKTQIIRKAYEQICASKGW